ncbi:MAG TPA: hypothetical protein VL096_05470, partial [Pirellulaceae bacterium]|nr:hypothetical protein [Pirellulaceae bacterium]
MTLVGKIFTVLIFIMSIVFMSFAVMVFATHKNWKEIALNDTPSANKPLGLKQQLTQAYEARKALDNELERYKAQLAEHQAARREVLARLQLKMESSVADLQKTQGELATLQAAHTVAVQNLSVAEANVEKAGVEVAGLRDGIKTIEEDRNDKLARVTALNDVVNQSIDKLRVLEERKDSLIGLVAQQKKVMDTYGLTVSTPSEKIPPPVDGLVSAVGDKGLIEVTIGKDDGLVPGHELQVYRDNVYLGKVIVRTVSANRAVGEIDQKFLKGQIRKGDKVATKI